MWLLENLISHTWFTFVAHIIFLLDNAAPDVRSLDPWMTAKSRTAPLQCCAITSPECFCKKKLQGSIFVPLGVQPMSPVCIPAPAELKERDLFTPRVKGMEEEYLMRWCSYDHHTFRLWKTFGKAGRERDKRWGI